jgi:hypothetical protein
MPSDRVRSVGELVWTAIVHRSIVPPSQNSDS